MSRNDTGSKPNSQRELNRRTLLRSALAGGAVVGSVGTATADGRGNSPAGTGDTGPFPPTETTTYGRAVDLGNGQVRPFTTETQSGAPKYHGVVFDRAALEGLPSADELADADNRAETDKYRAGGQAATIHFKQSQQYFVPFPDAAHTPFTFLGLNWNPEGHFGGKGAWLKPHFDVHFHMLDPATIDSIEGPKLPPYDESNGMYNGGSPAPDPEGEVTSTELGSEQLPEGYARAPDPVADQRYIRDMGEHAAPTGAPELPDGPDDDGDPDAFSNTLIQGFVGVGEADDPRLAFVEPMVTRGFLRGFSGSRTFDVPQPEVYPHDQQHPTEYSVRDARPKGGVAVVLQSFEPVEER